MNLTDAEIKTAERVARTMALRRGVPIDSVEDVIQDVLVGMLEKGHREGQSVAHAACRVAETRCRRDRKRTARAREVRIEITALPDPRSHDPAVNGHHRHLEELVTRSSLTDRERDVIRLAAKGYSQADIARRFGVTRMVVCTLLSRAKGKIARVHG